MQPELRVVEQTRGGEERRGGDDYGVCYDRRCYG